MPRYRAGLAGGTATTRITITPARRATAVDTDTPEAPVIHVVRQGLLRRPVLGDVDILGRRLRREFELNTRAGERARLCIRGVRGHALVCLDDRILILK